jgi:hypothetical protein
MGILLVNSLITPCSLAMTHPLCGRKWKRLQASLDFFAASRFGEPFACLLDVVRQGRLPILKFVLRRRVGRRALALFGARDVEEHGQRESCGEVCAVRVVAKRAFCNTTYAWELGWVFLRIVGPPYYGRDCAPGALFAHQIAGMPVFARLAGLIFLFLGGRGLRAAGQFCARADLADRSRIFREDPTTLIRRGFGAGPVS